MARSKIKDLAASHSGAVKSCFQERLRGQHPYRSSFSFTGDVYKRQLKDSAGRVYFDSSAAVTGAVSVKPDTGEALNDLTARTDVRCV